MPKENPDLIGALDHYRSLLETGEFFQAHEVLEEAWHPLRRECDPRRNLAKGLINAAIAFEHLRRDRPKSRRVAQKAMEAYDRYRHLCQPEIDAYYAFVASCQLVDTLRQEWEI